MKKRILLIFIVIGVVLGLTANCYALLYTEPPDLHGDSLGVLDLGTNAVTGNMFIDYPANSMDEDSFSFDIASGTMLNSITLDFDTSYIDYNGDGIETSGIVWGLYDSSYTLLDHVAFGSAEFYILGSGSTVLFSNLNIGPGIYHLVTGLGVQVGDAFSTDYTLNLQVDPGAVVPLPSTILLLGTGLVGLAGATRKKLKK